MATNKEDFPEDYSTGLTNSLPSKPISKNILLSAWTDPVGSNIISHAIIAIIAFSIPAIIDHFGEFKIMVYVINLLTYKLSIWIYLIILLLFPLIYFLYRFIKKKYFDDKTSGFPYHAKIGSYSFIELYNSLLSMPAMRRDPSKKTNLLFAFVTSINMYNLGVHREHRDSADLYYRFGTQLLSYGLCELVLLYNDLYDKKMLTIRTSEHGYKFYAYLIKYRLYKDDANDLKDADQT